MGNAPHQCEDAEAAFAASLAAHSDSTPFIGGAGEGSACGKKEETKALETKAKGPRGRSGEFGRRQWLDDNQVAPLGGCPPGNGRLPPSPALRGHPLLFIILTHKFFPLFFTSRLFRKERSLALVFYIIADKSDVFAYV